MTDGIATSNTGYADGNLSKDERRYVAFNYIDCFNTPYFYIEIK